MNIVGNPDSQNNLLIGVECRLSDHPDCSQQDLNLHSNEAVRHNDQIRESRYSQDEMENYWNLDKSNEGQ